jgi:hypothetical protein
LHDLLFAQEERQVVIYIYLFSLFPSDFWENYFKNKIRNGWQIERETDLLLCMSIFPEANLISGRASFLLATHFTADGSNGSPGCANCA